MEPALAASPPRRRAGHGVGARPASRRGGAVPAYDFAFVDADKASTADYFSWAVAHTRRGGLIVVDNVVPRGAVAAVGAGDANVEGIRRFLAAARADDRVELTAVQTVGAKGWDGMAVAVVR